MVKSVCSVVAAMFALVAIDNHASAVILDDFHVSQHLSLDGSGIPDSPLAVSPRGDLSATRTLLTSSVGVSSGRTNMLIEDGVYSANYSIDQISRPGASAGHQMGLVYDFDGAVLNPHGERNALFIDINFARGTRPPRSIRVLVSGNGGRRLLWREMPLSDGPYTIGMPFEDFKGNTLGGPGGLTDFEVSVLFIIVASSPLEQETFEFQIDRIRIEPVPEPGEITTFVFAAIVVLGYRRP